VRLGLANERLARLDLTAFPGSPDKVPVCLPAIRTTILRWLRLERLSPHRANKTVLRSRGISGTSRITFNGYTGWQKPEKVMKMLDGKQYVAYMAEGMANDGYTPADIADAGFQAGVDDQFSTNWQSAIFRTAPVHDLNLGFTGGTGRMKYYLSGSYFGQDGVAMGSSYDRASGRANVDIDPTERLSISASLALTREINHRVVGDNTIVGVVANSIAEQPNVPIYDSNGAFFPIAPAEGLGNIGAEVPTCDQLKSLRPRPWGSSPLKMSWEAIEPAAAATAPTNTVAANAPAVSVAALVTKAMPAALAAP
jgi:hypothetical protein